MSKFDQLYNKIIKQEKQQPSLINGVTIKQPELPWLLNGEKREYCERLNSQRLYQPIQTTEKSKEQIFKQFDQEIEQWKNKIGTDGIVDVVVTKDWQGFKSAFGVYWGKTWVVKYDNGKEDQYYASVIVHL